MDRIVAIAPDVVGFNVCSPSLLAAWRLAIATREILPSAVLVAGGAHASGWPDSLAGESSPFDVVVAGPGERPMSAVAASPSTYRRNRHERPPAVLYGNVSDSMLVRSPDYSVVVNSGSHRITELPLITSRGCEFGCKYCAIVRVFGSVVSRDSVATILANMDSALEKYGIRHFKILSENIVGSDHEHFRRLMLALAARKTFTFRCQARYDSLHPGDAEIMARAGCRRICLGIDAVSKKAQTASGRSLRLPRAIQAIKEFGAAGVECQTVFVVGFPDESDAEIEQTARVASTLRESGSSEVVFFPLMLFPGTPIWSQYSSKTPFGSIPLSTATRSLAPRDLTEHLEKYPLVPDVVACCKGSSGALMLAVSACYRYLRDGPSVWRTGIDNVGFASAVDMERDDIRRQGLAELNLRHG
jgi:radical SAM superfamily enzyme YgiQ (UPF0313 family)